MEELIRVQDEIVIDRTETKVTKENDDELTKEVIMLRNELDEVVSFWNNIDNKNRNVVEMLYQQRMEMKELRKMLEQVQKESLLYERVIDEREWNEIRKKDSEVMEVKRRELKKQEDEDKRYNRMVIEEESRMDLLCDKVDEVIMELMEVRMKMKRLCNEDRMNDCEKSCDGTVDMSSIPSEEQDKVLKILGMTESQLKDMPSENYFGTRIGRTGAKEQVIYNFDLWMQYPVLNQDASHLELNERYKINYAYGSPLVMGSIQARTIWIQKSVYKPINWNDVEKDGVENQRAIIPVQNIPDPLDETSMPELIPPLEHRTDPNPNPEPEEESSTMSGPTVEIPSSIQITENNIPHAKDELTDREVYELCNELIKGYKLAYENGYKPFKDALLRFFGKYDKNVNRMRSTMVNAIKRELTKPEMSSEFESLINVFCICLTESDQAIAKRLFDKINSKRGDIGRDAFWDLCKRNEITKKYYTDNIETHIPKGERPLPNVDFVIPPQRLIPPEPTQLPNTEYEDSSSSKLAHVTYF